MAEIRNIGKTKREIIALRGINYSKQLADGDIADSKNISLDKFPYITTAKTDTALSGTGYENVKAMAAYKKLYTVANGTMYADGTSTGISTPVEEKQTAMMANGTMMLLPDEKLINPDKKELYSGSADKDKVVDLSRFFAQFDTINEAGTGIHYFFSKFGGDKTAAELASFDDYKGTGQSKFTYYKATQDGNITTYAIDGEYTTTEPQGTDVSFTAGQVIGIKYTIPYGTTTTNDDTHGGNVETIFTATRYYRVVTVTEYSSNAHFEADKWAYISDPANKLNGSISDISKWGVAFADDGSIYSIETRYKSGRSSILSVTAKSKENTAANTYEGATMTSLVSPTEVADNKGNVVMVRRGDMDDIIGAVTSVDTNKIVVTGFPPTGSSIQNGYYYTFRRCEVPDFVCSWANRFWCCNNERQLIFASEQGEARNFYTDMSLASGSYQVALGDSEFFTGCCEYGNGVLFFKQNRIYKIVGTSPKNYKLYTYEVEGVKKGCHKSLCVINNILYYVGLHGVYAYSGGRPVLISERLGNIEMNNAVGGTDGEKYYLSFESGGKDYLFTYDPKYQIWLLKDNIKVQDFAKTEDNFYYLADDTVHKASVGATSTDTEWHIQFTPFYEKMGEKQYTRLILRYELAEKSYMTIKIRTDGGVWEVMDKLIGKAEGLHEVRLPTMRSDKFELRIEGKGEATILEIDREFEVRSVVK